jgi:hypothetical protein
MLTPLTKKQLKQRIKNLTPANRKRIDIIAAESGYTVADIVLAIDSYFSAALHDIDSTGEGHILYFGNLKRKRKNDKSI